MPTFDVAIIGTGGVGSAALAYLAQSGASLLEIADVLGHKQISVTQRYAHLCIEHKSKLINEVMLRL